MFCGECGKKIKEGSKFCTGCGTKVEPISTVNTPVMNQETIEIKDNKIEEVMVEEKKEDNNNNNTNNTYTNNSNQNTNYNVKEDKSSIWFNILAFFVPIVGLILFITMKNETPKKAKAIGISALIGYILSIIVSIILFVYVYGVMLFKYDDDYKHNTPNNRNYNYYIERDYNI